MTYVGTLNSLYTIHVYIAWVDPDGGAWGPAPPCKITICYICYLRNTGTDLPREAIGPQVQLFLEGGPYGPLGKTLMTEKTKQKVFRTP